MTTNSVKSQQRLRFAIYARYSSDMQNELSLEDQEKCCRKAIAERGGTVIGVYTDAAKSGWSLDREGFNKLRVDAERGRFDAVMFWKFDRLARNHEQSVLIKILLRRDYGLKLFCVEGFSEDDDDSAYTALMEQLLAVFYAFYSKNLSSDTKRAKVSRFEDGKFNGSVAPLGYELITKAMATDERPAGLYIVLVIAAIVRFAFRLYATGKYSDAKIAEWMNSKKAIQKLRAGKQPINKEMVRDMLQNRTYLGEVCHADTQYSGSLGEGKKSARKRKVWVQGNHQGFVSEDLFDQCQKVRANMAHTRKSETVMRTYVLHDRVYCALCTA
ncbi:MAG: recombinase family protein [Anaerolineae bacterium]|nr:recombinase family protein [Anaerolineae bacterium]